MNRRPIEHGELPPEPAGESHPATATAPDAIQALLDTLRNRHGSIEDYFLAHGLGTRRIERLRDTLLE